MFNIFSSIQVDFRSEFSRTKWWMITKVVSTRVIKNAYRVFQQQELQGPHSQAF